MSRRHFIVIPAAPQWHDVGVVHFRSFAEHGGMGKPRTKKGNRARKDIFDVFDISNTSSVLRLSAQKSQKVEELRAFLSYKPFFERRSRISVNQIPGPHTIVYETNPFMNSCGVVRTSCIFL